VVLAGGADGEDLGVPRQRVHRGSTRTVLQTKPLRLPLQRRPTTGRGESHELRPARWTLSSAGRRHCRLHRSHVRRARHLQVARQLLATQARQELLEESIHDVLEPGIPVVRFVSVKNIASVVR